MFKLIEKTNNQMFKLISKPNDFEVNWTAFFKSELSSFHNNYLAQNEGLYMFSWLSVSQNSASLICL